MFGCAKIRSSFVVAVSSVALLTSLEAHGATKTVDLDGNAANGAESQCDLNVLQTFPVMIEAKVTNKSGGDAFTFNWPSAGPGGFTSSVPAGTAGGVGAKWVWTTDQSVFSYTGTSCANDVCFAQTGGPDQLGSYCNYACLADGTSLKLSKGGTAGSVVASWTGGQATFTVYRSTVKTGITVPANAIGTTDTLSFNDTPPPDTTFFYVVRGTDCTARKACTSDSACSAPGDGPCVSRGPFGVPGRSLFSNSVTVSAASLTSSLITFFSPPKEIFRATSTANAGGFGLAVSNLGSNSVTFTVPAYPPGCCPANPDVPHQLRCGETCVDYLNDPNNCGGCGVVCGDGSCCSNGVCSSLCAKGQQWCDDECVDTSNDNKNCGTCGTPCPDGTCCNGGECASLCPAGQVWCGNACVDTTSDSANCGACGAACGDGTCCNGSECVSVCPVGQVWCNNACVDLENDSANCGTCGTSCETGTCCNGGECESFCPAGQVLCGAQCVDFNNDSANCGACGNACGSGSCCDTGQCESFCPAGQVLCGTQCVDFNNDSANCGACGNACGTGSCCNGGQCESFCPAGQVLCGTQCVDVRNDSDNCGACGTTCGSGTCCYGGACVSECPAGRTFCNGSCVDLQNDSRNCGSCGHVCGHSSATSDNDDNECEHGQCEHSDLYDPTHDSSPIPAVCPNPAPTHPTPGYCHNSNPTNPTPGYCHNDNPTEPKAGFCRNTNPTNPGPGSCPNPNPSSPEPGYCPNPNPSPGPVAGVCPEAGEPTPIPDETANCTVDAHTETVAPGASTTTCNPGGILFKEVPTEITVCGDGIPGVDGLCNNSASKVTTGTFNRLVPDTTKTIGNAYVTPYAVHIMSDTSNDGLLEPGESASLVIDVVNAGPMNITQASATLSAPAVDLSDDGVANPVGLTVGTGSASYGTILGTPVSTNCNAPTPHPASNVTVFPITVPASHPGDTSHQVNLAVTGTVNGGPFTMNVPISLGIADKCDAAANTRDYDGLDGMASPMAKLVPTGDPVQFPSKAFVAGNTRPLKLRMTCGNVNLTDSMVDAPEIVGLSEATRGPLNIHLLNLNADNTNNPNDPFFRFNNSLQGGQWAYSMRTSLIGTGSFTLTIRIAGRKDYVAGFVLN